MKILKYLLYVLLALVLIGVVLGLVGPKTYDIRRSKVITASADQVWPYVSNWENINKWSPWVRMDTTMNLEYAGTQGTVGSSYSWKSKKMGSGNQTILSLEPNKSMEAELKIKMFGESTSPTGFALMDTAGGTQVNWHMSGTNNFIGRIMGSLMNQEKMIGKTFDDGLNNLQEMIATMPATPAASEIKIIPGDYAGGKFLGVRAKSKISELKSFYETSMPKVMEGVKSSKAEMAGPSSGVYYTWEPDKDMTDVAASAPIKNEVKAPAGLSYFTIPASKSLTIDYMGGYSGMDKAHNAMDAYIKANNLTHTAPVLEEYVADAMSESDSTKWHTRIIYFVK